MESANLDYFVFWLDWRGV